MGARLYEGTMVRSPDVKAIMHGVLVHKGVGLHPKGNLVQSHMVLRQQCMGC